MAPPGLKAKMQICYFLDSHTVDSQEGTRPSAESCLLRTLASGQHYQQTTPHLKATENMLLLIKLYRQIDNKNLGSSYQEQGPAVSTTIQALPNTSHSPGSTIPTRAFVLLPLWWLERLLIGS